MWKDVNCSNGHQHFAVCAGHIGSCMPSRRRRWLDMPLLVLPTVLIETFLNSCTFVGKKHGNWDKIITIQKSPCKLFGCGCYGLPPLPSPLDYGKTTHNPELKACWAPTTQHLLILTCVLPNTTLCNQLTRLGHQLTSNFLNCCGNALALWGMWKSPMTSTSCGHRTQCSTSSTYIWRASWNSPPSYTSLLLDLSSHVFFCQDICCQQLRHSLSL